jgi:biopolymer transport protein ExbD
MRLPRQPPKKGRIEIVPMIDAIFFLLVFFIMTSLSMVQINTQGAELPKSRTGQDRPTPGERMIVALSRDNALFVDSEPASEADVRARVAARVAKNPQIPVLLTADKNADVTRFLRVFDLVKQADAANVIVATEPDDARSAAKSAAPTAKDARP